jgi:hypothetical protein
VSNPDPTLLVMPQLSLGRRLDAALIQLALAPQGSATDYSREVVSSTPDKKKEPPLPDLSADVWSDKAQQLVSTIEELLGGELARPSMSLRDLKDAVRPLAGHSSGFVAYSLGERLERVEQARVALGADPTTGLPKPRALTSREVPA